MEQQILKRTVRRYVIAWYNGLNGRPDYSTRSFDTIEEARAAAEQVIGTKTATSLTASSIQSHTARRRNLTATTGFLFKLNPLAGGVDFRI